MNLGRLDQQLSKHDNMEPFLNMLDPSGALEESPAYKEFRDFFFYAQLEA